MVVKHCCYGLCPSDFRYVDKLPSGTVFLPFAKPGVVKGGMTEFEKQTQNIKKEKAKRWGWGGGMYACVEEKISFSSF